MACGVSACHSSQPWVLIGPSRVPKVTMTPLGLTFETCQNIPLRGTSAIDFICRIVNMKTGFSARIIVTHKKKFSRFSNLNHELTNNRRLLGGNKCWREVLLQSLKLQGTKTIKLDKAWANKWKLPSHSYLLTECANSTLSKLKGDYIFSSVLCKLTYSQKSTNWGGFGGVSIGHSTIGNGRTRDDIHDHIRVKQYNSMW